MVYTAVLEAVLRGLSSNLSPGTNHLYCGGLARLEERWVCNN
jgi:hypothetical protein